MNVLHYRATSSASVEWTYVICLHQPAQSDCICSILIMTCWTSTTDHPFSLTNSHSSHLFIGDPVFKSRWAEVNLHCLEECMCHVSTDNGDTNSRLVLCMCPLANNAVRTGGQGHRSGRRPDGDNNWRGQGYTSWLARRRRRRRTQTAEGEPPGAMHRWTSSHRQSRRLDLQWCKPDTAADIGPW